MVKTEIYVSPEEYLKLERPRLEKHQYFNGTIIKMSGASINHNRIASKLARMLGNLLDEDNFEVFQSDLRVHNPVNNSFTYPDIVVIKGEPEFYDGAFDTVKNPIFLLEVLPKSTYYYDITDKHLIYSKLDSLQEYVLIEQNKKLIYRYLKDSPTKWTIEHISEEQETIEFISLGLTVKIDDIYKNVKFD